MTYNGRGFDWPLLVTRYRMAGREAPSTPATWTCWRSSGGMFRHGSTTRG